MGELRRGWRKWCVSGRGRASECTCAQFTTKKLPPYFPFFGLFGQTSGNSPAASDADSEALGKIREELNSKNALTYTLQNRVTVLDREAKEMAERVANEQLKCRKMESEVKEERAKRETIRRQMDGYKMQVNDASGFSFRFPKLPNELFCILHRPHYI